MEAVPSKKKEKSTCEDIAISSSVVERGSRTKFGLRKSPYGIIIFTMNQGTTTIESI